MTPAFFFGFATGAIVALFIATVFFAAKWHELYEKGQKLEVELWNCTQRAEHLEHEANPLMFVDSPEVKVRARASQRLYDKHDALVKPGTEIIRIEDQGDTPDGN